MDILPLLCVVSAAFAGLTKGAGVLPDGPLNAAVGATVMFTTTLTPSDKPFLSVVWTFGTKNIITSSSVNKTGPEYEGRITFFMSTGSLELRNLALNDSGEYSVSIVPDGESVEAGSTTLKVLEPVSNVTATASSTDLVEFNSSVRLSCSSSGSSLSFLWLNSSSEVTASDRVQLTDGGSILTIVKVTRYDQGPFRCRVSNPVSNGTSDPITLSISLPVSNVTATASSADLVEFNSSVRLSCSSSGSSLSFLWLNGSSEVTASDRVQLTDGGSTLTIVNVTRYDQGPFRCRVFNPVSNGTSDPVNLSISYGPENINLTISPSQEYYGKGSNVTLMCSAVSKPAALFHWFLNGDLLSDTGPELRLMNIQMSQSGNHSCQAFNDKTLRYETSQPSAVSVLERISGAFVTPTTNLTIEGISVNLTCDAAGSVFTRKWMKDGSDLTLAGNMNLYDKNKVLSFNSLKSTDTGEYSCKISNPLSNDEAKYTMVVYYGPENVQIAGPSEIHVGESFTLTCSADSTPSATYTWILNGTEIHNSAEFTKDNADLSDSGSYTCQAMNSITERTSTAVHGLSVTVKPSGKPSGCSAGCIAGIVIAVFVCGAAGGGGGYYMYKKKKLRKHLSNKNTATRTGGEGQNNSAYSASQELNYADISFQNKDGGRVQLGLQNNTSEYAQVQVNNNPPAVSSPPSYDAHLQRTKSPAPSPDANPAQVYSQVRKN
ncbi:carcinoembryonic antigen-related cell adhesion molecule 5-like [Sander lucioperca]|uniref:carcinoembryonic antigen-related cell adhesion molecule 5-like n=1 Tax=Sander lucioperca TaxID=283035 RepID=UPI0016536EFF|nr:carcinoembryonic antigen-related cell adhesion molecule 5-like [Sander lucioperca]